MEAALGTVNRPVVMTGIGGDEVFALRPEERTAFSASRPAHAAHAFLTPAAQELANTLAGEPDDVPMTIVPETALNALMVRAPVFLRAGRWPVSPLCAPELVRFGEWLPFSWRQGKRLPREWLVSQGVPHEVAWPQLRENFVPVMQQGLRRHGLSPLHQMLAVGSVLVDLGYVDPDEVRRATGAADAAVARGNCIEPCLYELLALDRGLRTLLG